MQQLIENKIKETIPFTIIWTNSIEINLVKDVQGTENYKGVLRLVKEDLSKWGNMPCQWTRRLNIF